MTEPQLEYEVSRTVDCHDLDKFVNMHLEGFGITWRTLESNPYDGYNNDSFASAEVKIGRDVEDDYDQDFGRWLLGEGPFYLDPDGKYSYENPGVEHMLQWLCNMGKIPEGHYVVKIWW